MRATVDQIDAEASLLERLGDKMGLIDSIPFDAAAEALRKRLTPGQVQTLYGTAGRDAFDGAMAAANWAAGLTAQRPTEVLL